MKASHAASVLAAAALALAGWGLMAPANAAPPTVTPSPGYDARLQEQRAAQRYQGPYYGAAVPEFRPAFRHHRKRLHHGAR
ncbi:MAG: hypothetical protein ACJ8EK_00900 [Bradyrhizobium sp.]|jgi:hypothetical protein